MTHGPGSDHGIDLGGPLDAGPAVEASFIGTWPPSDTTFWVLFLTSAVVAAFGLIWILLTWLF